MSFSLLPNGRGINAGSKGRTGHSPCNPVQVADQLSARFDQAHAALAVIGCARGVDVQKAVQRVFDLLVLLDISGTLLVKSVEAFKQFNALREPHFVLVQAC